MERTYTYTDRPTCSRYIEEGKPQPKHSDLLYKIVKFLCKRYQDGEDSYIPLNDIMEGIKIKINTTTATWLKKEALINNPKIEAKSDGALYKFRPTYEVRDAKSLMALLKSYYRKGWGGIRIDDLKETFPNVEKAILRYGKSIITIERSDKKKIIFYRNVSDLHEIDDKYKKMWYSVQTDHLDFDQSVSGLMPPGEAGPSRRVKQPAKRAQKKPKDNEHVADILETYVDNDLEHTHILKNPYQG